MGAFFPDIIGSDLVDQTDESATVSHLYSRMGRGYANVYVKALRLRARYRAVWEVLESAERDAIAEHVQQQFGGRFSFYWLHWHRIAHRWVPVGIGDGSTKRFTIPGFQSFDHQFFGDGAAALNGNVSYGTGNAGMDQVEFFAPPAPAVRITTSCIMRRRFLMFFHPDTQIQLPRLLDAVKNEHTFECQFVEAKFMDGFYG